MINYKCIDQQTFSDGEYKLIPIRFEDRYDIMKWRNEQMYHLRQTRLLTIEQQDEYFSNVIAPLFDKDHPEQLLFSFFKKDELIGYGGLVHIHWENRNAEVSFLTKNEKDLYLWLPYLNLLKELAFKELNLNKIYTYAYDLRPLLYSYLIQSNFIMEGILGNHVMNEQNLCDVKIHSCFNENYSCWRRHANFSDAKILFDWANNRQVRNQSLNNQPIRWDTHLDWFWRKLQDELTKIYIYYNYKQPVGNLRLEYVNNYYKISYLIDEAYQGMGFGKRIIEDVIKKTSVSLKAEVKANNLVSNRIFEKNGFLLQKTNQELNTWIYVR